MELVNIGTTELSTEGWKLGDATEMDPLPAMLVPSNGYVVVAGRSASLPAGVSVVRVDDGQIGGGLNNTGDTLHLVAPDGDEFDSLSYGDNDSILDPPPPAPPTGATLGVRVPDSDPDADNWSLTDHPTPGEQNSFAAPRAEPAKGGAVADAPAADVVPSPLVIRPAERGVPVVLWVIVAALGSAVVVLLLYFGWDRLVAPKDKTS